MQSTKQQQILGYFIEEAKEHLETIEQGLLDLQAAMEDPERVKELFRAAHSVKGGAAMLGINSIQTTAHHLEDSFKLLCEHPVTIDQQLESLFLQIFDTLQELLDQLQSPFGLNPEEAERTVRDAEPVFAELQNYMNGVVAGRQSVATTPSQPVLPANFANQTMAALKLMLQLFKQSDTSQSRQQLQGLCLKLAQLVEAQSWRMLMQTSQRAIANPKNSYATLAPLVIKELKQGSDLLISGRSHEVVPSNALQQMAGTAQPAPAPPVVAPTPQIAAPTKPAAAPPATAPKPGQITIPLEPRAAAKALIAVFTKEQLTELAKVLVQAIR